MRTHLVNSRERLRALRGEAATPDGLPSSIRLANLYDVIQVDSPRPMDPAALKSAISDGLLSFPLTDFTPDLAFDAEGYRRRLEWLMPYGATALFAAGGTGEFFSLAPREFRKVIEVASHTCAGKVPIIAGTGAGHALAIEFAREAEAAGASGLLLLPHYLTEASQAGLAAHVRAVCRAVKIGVIVYNRGACRLQPSTLESLAADCPNLVGFKDGIGDIELMVSIRRRLGDRFAYLGGLPTAEVFAPAYRAMGVPVYSSAVFNFIPATAMRFYRALVAGDTRPSTTCSTGSSCRTSRSATAARATR